MGRDGAGTGFAAGWDVAAAGAGGVSATSSAPEGSALGYQTPAEAALAALLMAKEAILPDAQEWAYSSHS
ncbi:MAG: hypothetical protein ACYC3S_08150 [Chloroflexota bacterium]